MNNHHYNKNLKLKARELRKNPTKAEKQMWVNYLSRRQFEGFRFLHHGLKSNRTRISSLEGGSGG